MNGCKGSKEGGGVLIIRFWGGRRLEQVLRLRNRSISASGKTKEETVQRIGI
jgi:hypothetical protein